MNYPDVIQQVAATHSLTAKKKILEENQNSKLKKIFEYAYDPFVTFGVHKVDMSDLVHATEVPEDWTWELFELLENLKSRELTGNAAKDAVRTVMRHAPVEHAQMLMNILNKDLRMGAGSRLINKIYPNLIPEDTHMSANKYDIKRVTFPVYADTKLDGVRCLAQIEEKVTLFSRNAKEFANYETIEKELKWLGLPEHTMLDGEITMGHFQDLMRTVNRKDAGIELAKDAVYNIFDIVDLSATFETRLYNLQQLQSVIDTLGLSHLRLVTGRLMETEEELLKFYEEQLAKGEEGVMVKPLSGMYEFKRSFAWQKMKPELSDDMRIVGFEEGKGKYVGQLGVIICKLENGGEVRVGSGFKDEERESLWAKRDELIDVIAEVKYQEKTKDGSLRFPIFIRFRQDKS